MQPVAIRQPAVAAPIVLTCEHASCAIPLEYDALGLGHDEIADHIGWDIGAADLTATLAASLDAAAVFSSVSRLLIDCNRSLLDHDLIVEHTHGVHVPGNQRLDADERARRLRDYYDPYHVAIDALLQRHGAANLLSVHSFTPELNGRERRFDVGVLYDEYERDARHVGEHIAESGLRVRYNQPYSGLDGLIYSARTHGANHARRYIELEVNNVLLRDTASINRIAAIVLPAVRSWMEASCG